MLGKRWQLPGGLGRFSLLWPVVALLRIIWWCAQWMDSIAARIIRRFVPLRYERTGNCLKTGMCCEFIAMEVPKVTERWPLLLGFLLRVGEIVYPFKLHARAGDGFLYTCYNFDAERRICRNYRFRPRVCRDYPEIGFFSRPKFFKGCGFSVRLRGKKGSFVEILDGKRRGEAPDFSKDLDLEPEPTNPQPDFRDAPNLEAMAVGLESNFGETLSLEANATGPKQEFSEAHNLEAPATRPTPADIEPSPGVNGHA